MSDSKIKYVAIPEPVDVEAHFKAYDPDNDIPDIKPQLVQVYEAEETITVMNDIVLRYAFKGVTRI